MGELLSSIDYYEVTLSIGASARLETRSAIDSSSSSWITTFTEALMPLSTTNVNGSYSVPVIEPYAAISWGWVRARKTGRLTLKRE